MIALVTGLSFLPMLHNLIFQTFIRVLKNHKLKYCLQKLKKGFVAVGLEIISKKKLEFKNQMEGVITKS